MCTKQRGFSLIEVVIAMVIIGVGMAGTLGVMTLATKHSADPMLQKQALSIAESLLAEIEQQPFTYCDPQDGNVLTAASAAGCAVAANDQNRGGAALAPTPGTETRGHSTDPYDNVADYAGYAQTPATDVTGGNAMAGYASTVTITRAGGVAPFAALPADAVLKISVTVAGPGRTSVVLVGYRFRYAPNAAG